MQYFDLYLYSLTVPIAFIYRDKLEGSVLKYLPYFLLVDLLVDIFSVLLVIVFHTYNVWAINLLVNIEILFIFFLYYHLFRNINYRKFTLYFAVAYEIFFIVYYLMSGDWNIYQEMPIFIGILLAIIVLMLFILDMLSSDDFLFIHKYTVFWITVAFLFYFIIPFPVSFWIHLFYKYGNRYIMEISVALQNAANVLMYITLIFGFIWSKKRYK